MRSRENTSNYKLFCLPIDERIQNLNNITIQWVQKRPRFVHRHIFFARRYVCRHTQPQSDLLYPREYKHGRYKLSFGNIQLTLVTRNTANSDVRPFYKRLLENFTKYWPHRYISHHSSNNILIVNVRKRRPMVRIISHIE